MYLVICNNTNENFLWEPEKVNVNFHKITSFTWNFQKFTWLCFHNLQYDWLISGPLGLALCKLFSYLPLVSYSVSGQSHVLIAVDRFVAVVFPLRSPLIGRKLFPFIITSTWIVALALHSPVLGSAEVFNYPDSMWIFLERSLAQFSSV